MMRELGTHACPDAEGAVDVHPSIVTMSRVDDLGERIDRPRVHLARLGHHDGRTVALGECSCQTLNLCSAVIVGGYNLEHVGAEAEQPQGTIDGHVTLRTDDHSDLRGAPQSLPGEIPSGSSKHLVSGGGEAGHVRHLTAGHESNRRLGRQAEEIFEPPAVTSSTMEAAGLET